jgi:hypothetical protein
MKDLRSELAKNGIVSSFTYENDGQEGFIMNMEVYEPIDMHGSMQRIIDDVKNSKLQYKNIQVDCF